MTENESMIVVVICFLSIIGLLFIGVICSYKKCCFFKKEESSVADDTIKDRLAYSLSKPNLFLSKAPKDLSSESEDGSKNYSKPKYSSLNSSNLEAATKR